MLPQSDYYNLTVHPVYVWKIQISKIQMSKGLSTWTNIERIAWHQWDEGNEHLLATLVLR